MRKGYAFSSAAVGAAGGGMNGRLAAGEPPRVSTKNPDVEGSSIQVRPEESEVCLKNPERIGSGVNDKFGVEELIMMIFFGLSRVVRNWKEEGK
jgi:hypothetical protein